MKRFKYFGDTDGRGRPTWGELNRWIYQRLYIILLKLWGVKNFPRILGAIYTGGYIRGYIFCNKTRAPEIFYAFWGEGQKGRFYSGGFKLLDISEAIYHRI